MNTTVLECPWRTMDGKCLTVECAEFGPLFRISQSGAALIVAFVTDAVADGALYPGERIEISLGARSGALCPRAYSEPVSEVLLRHAAGPSIDVEIDGHVAYVKAL